MITSVFCWFGFHRPIHGLDKSMALVWVCRHCGALNHGGLGVRR